MSYKDREIETEQRNALIEINKKLSIDGPIDISSIYKKLDYNNQLIASYKKYVDDNEGSIKVDPLYAKELYDILEGLEGENILCSLREELKCHLDKLEKEYIKKQLEEVGLTLEQFNKIKKLLK